MSEPAKVEAPMAAVAKPGPRRRLLDRLGEPSPVLVKELLAAFRTPLYVRFLYLSTAILALIVVFGATIAGGEATPPASVGPVLFQVFFGVAAFILGIAAPGYAAAAITSEREGRTYESLILTSLSPWDIVRGKFLACFASVALVVVANTPVVGIAFLLGGLSPLHFVAATYHLMLFVAVAIGLGIAISARLKTTRVAVVLAVVVFGVLGMVMASASALMLAVSMLSRGSSASGPINLIDAFVRDPFDPVVLCMGFVAPTVVAVMVLWFMLASAVIALRPSSEPRSGPMKLWAIVASTSMFAVVAVGSEITSGANDPLLAFAFAVLAPLQMFYAFLFTAEPALVPMRIEAETAALPVWRRTLSTLFGSGAIPTWLFTVLWITLHGLASGVSFPWLLSKPAEPIFILFVGAIPVAVALASFGVLLRVVTKSPALARSLTAGAWLITALLPILAVVAAKGGHGELTDANQAYFAAVSSIWPALLAVMTADNPSQSAAPSLIVTSLLYGASAALFAILAILKVKSLAGARAASRAAAARVIADDGAVEGRGGPEGDDDEPARA